MLYTKRLFIFFIFILFWGFYASKQTNLLNDEFIKNLVTDQQVTSSENQVKVVKENVIFKNDSLKKEILCLAKNIYYEARGEPFFGQVAVARVVINRIKDAEFPNSSCEVVYQKTFNKNLNKHICQFSWVCERLLPPKKGSDSYRLAMLIAELVLLNNEWSNIIHDRVLFFHSTYVNPGWKYEYVTTIGNHKFFKLDD